MLDRLPPVSARRGVFLFHRGIAYQQSHQWPKAESDLEAALQLRPDDPALLNYLAFSWADQGVNLDRARAMLERAIQLVPDDGAFIDSLGWVMYRAGDYEDAVKQLEHAVALDNRRRRDQRPSGRRLLEGRPADRGPQPMGEGGPTERRQGTDRENPPEAQGRSRSGRYAEARRGQLRVPEASLTLAAPAKVNLYLHVTGRRDDGYHLLDSLVAFADIADVLTLSPAPSLAFSADGPFAADMGDDSADNLVVRAAGALAEAVGRKPDVALHLTKNLPVASGIGGGSADARCLPARPCGMVGHHAGCADPAPGRRRARFRHPACVAGRACYMGGIGTDLAPCPRLPGAGLVLVNPGIQLSTPAVYRARQGGFSPPMRFQTAPEDARPLAALLAGRTNDLAAAAISLAPEIAAVITAIGAAPSCLIARMSGSGATCFGLFEDVAGAARAASEIQRAHPAWWVASGRLVEDVAEL